MADRLREVIWTFQARTMLDEAVGYIAQDSLTAAQRLLIDALDAGASPLLLARSTRLCEVAARESVKPAGVTGINWPMRSGPACLKNIDKLLEAAENLAATIESSNSNTLTNNLMMGYGQYGIKPRIH